MNFSPTLLRNGNIFRIHTELISYSESKKTMNTTNVYVIFGVAKKKPTNVYVIFCVTKKKPSRCEKTKLKQQQ